MINVDATGAVGLLHRDASSFAPNPRSLLTETEAADLLALSVRTLQGFRHRGGGPPYVSLSRRAVRYRLSDLEAWIDERVRSSTSDPGPV